MSKKVDGHEVLFLKEYHKSAFLTFMEFLPGLKVKNHNCWQNGIQIKIDAVFVLSDEVKNQYHKALKEREDIEEKGIGSGLESTLLLIKFETLLNSIYSLCDNLAFIGNIFHHGISRSFNQQRIKIESYRQKYPQYSEYFVIIESASWYEELHTMRSESTHYLPGFVYFSEKGLGILYQNMEHSNERINIENILEYVNELIVQVDSFLEQYGKYHLNQFVSDDNTTFHPCFIPDPSGKGFLVGGRTITLAEYKDKKPGKCVTLQVPCPKREKCPAFLKE